MRRREFITLSEARRRHGRSPQACGASREHSQNRRAMARSLAPCFTPYGVVSAGDFAVGYVDGQNVAIELRYAQGGLNSFPTLLPSWSA